jgi:hypothetical protein
MGHGHGHGSRVWRHRGGSFFLTTDAALQHVLHLLHHTGTGTALTKALPVAKKKIGCHYYGHGSWSWQDESWQDESWQMAGGRGNMEHGAYILYLLVSRLGLLLFSFREINRQTGETRLVWRKPCHSLHSQY